MLGWFKFTFPLLIQLLEELFRADGDAKLGFGTKVALLFNITLISALIYVGGSYFEIYTSKIKSDMDLTARDEEIVQLKTSIKKLETQLVNAGQCEICDPPSESYEQSPVPVYVPNHELVGGATINETRSRVLHRIYGT